jgi:spore germination protein KC
LRKKIAVTLLISCLFLTGCWDNIELNDIAIVTGMGIDPGKDKKYRLTVGYVNPAQFSKQNPSQGAPVSSFSLEGNSLPEIAARMNIGVSRRLVFSHTRAIYINEDIAKEGVSAFLDSLERSGQFRNDFNILITQGHDAEKFTMINDPLEKVPSLKTQKQIKTIVEGWGGDPRVRLTDFINAIVSKGRSSVATKVIIKGNPEKGKNAESNMSVEPEANILLDGMGVFKHDKLLGFLTLEETRNFNWTQQLDHTMVSIPCRDNDDDDEKEKQYFDLVVTNNKPNLKTYYQGDTPQLKVNIYAEGRINSMQCPEDLTKLSIYEDMEEKSAKYIENVIMETIKKVQDDFGVDIFGFGEALHRQHYQKSKEVEDNWDEEFKRAEVEVTAKVAIRRSGIRNRGFNTNLPKEAQGE